MGIPPATVQADPRSFLQRVTDWAAVLWACRISAITGIAASGLYDFVPQGRDIFADTTRNAHLLYASWYWFAAILGMFFVWALPVHFAARKTLEQSDDWLLSKAQRTALPDDCRAVLYQTLRARYDRPIRLVPRFLGFFPFLIVAISQAVMAWELYDASALPWVEGALHQIYCLLGLTAVAALLFWRYVIKRREVLRSPAGAMLAKIFNLLRDLLFILFILALLRPDWVSELYPRAILPPLLFGGATILFAWLARWSDKTGWPVVFLGIAVAMVLTALNWHFHDVRTARAENDSGPPVQVGARATFAEAVARWRVANDCGATASPPKKCPPAVIVAAEGGASRAAFFAATVIGDLFDTPAPGATAADKTYPMINRLFAMSGVSGGSVGAAVIHAAVADWRDSGAWPCVKNRETWFKAGETSGPPTTWRGCLQLLTSGDYLTPVFVGMGFRDNIAPPFLNGAPIWEDRAALLERAWEAHYDYVSSNDVNPPALASQRGLHRRIGAASQNINSKPWVPLVFLNSTSVETGRRIIVAETEAAWNPGDGPRPVYPEAFDLFEMMAQQCDEVPPNPSDPAKCKAKPNGSSGAADIRLSVGAIISARFPVISPPGTIRDATYDDTDGNHRGGQAVDRVVDGGVFENAGLTTAREIAVALRQAGIVPIILHINNDPLERTSMFVPPRGEKMQTPWMDEGNASSFLKRLFGTIGGPVQALYDTRQGHGAEARLLAGQTVNTKGGPASDPSLCPSDKCLFDIDVRASPPIANQPDKGCKPPSAALKMDVVSMSWWLSPPVQAFLDVQLCENYNLWQVEMAKLRELLAAAP